VLSICVISMEKEHLLLSLPWLAGSTITIFLDFFVSPLLSTLPSYNAQSCATQVLGQFFYYRAEEGTLHLSDNTNAQEHAMERP
jgi:hypothetical protein